jgi:hypothetical protein
MVIYIVAYSLVVAFSAEQNGSVSAIYRKARIRESQFARKLYVYIPGIAAEHRRADHKGCSRIFQSKTLGFSPVSKNLGAVAALPKPQGC